MFFKAFNFNEKFPISVLKQKPIAIASIRGKENYKELKGEVLFLKDESQIMLQIDVSGLEKRAEDNFQFVLISVNNNDFAMLNEKQSLNYMITKFNHKENNPIFLIEPNENGKMFACFLTDKIEPQILIGHSVDLFITFNSLDSNQNEVYLQKIASGKIVKT